ncbi:hypothetical protein BDR26DRAFT_853242 [Obelidium mucronatum]|nr:hypothetical protein BDR26DRAFT_853242 [Obelidium mucronatum]
MAFTKHLKISTQSQLAKRNMSPQFIVIQNPRLFKRSVNKTRLPASITQKRLTKEPNFKSYYRKHCSRTQDLLEEEDSDSDQEFELELAVPSRKYRHYPRRDFHRYDDEEITSESDDDHTDEGEASDSDDTDSNADSVEYLFEPAVLDRFKSHKGLRSNAKKGSFGQGYGVLKRSTHVDSSSDSSDSSSDEDEDDIQFSDLESEPESEDEEGIFYMSDDDNEDVDSGESASDDSDVDSERLLYSRSLSSESEDSDSESEVVFLM